MLGMTENRWKSGILAISALFMFMAGATETAAQTRAAGNQVAVAATGTGTPANVDPASSAGTFVVVGAQPKFVISTALGLGRLDISSLTGGLVRDADAPTAKRSGGRKTRIKTATSGRATDTETASARTATLIETSIRIIQQTAIATKERSPEPSSGPVSTGTIDVGGDIGGGIVGIGDDDAGKPDRDDDDGKPDRDDDHGKPDRDDDHGKPDRDDDHGKPDRDDDKGKKGKKHGKR